MPVSGKKEKKRQKQKKNTEIGKLGYGSYEIWDLGINEAELN